MYSLPLLALLPLALTLPNTQRQNQSCTTQQWNIQQFEAFTAGSSLSPGAPSIFSYDHVSFYFNDPNFGLRALCERSIEPGTGQLADDRLYPCDGSSMFFRYVGASITLQRTDVHCGKYAYHIQICKENGH